MGLHRGVDGSEPVRPEPVTSTSGSHEERRNTRLVATGTVACPECDAPVALAGPLRPQDALSCPYCLHQGFLRDFLSLDAPSRPARVTVRVLAPYGWSSRRPARRA